MGSERGRATLAGLGAIGLWALLAPLGVAAGPVPPFLLTALSFAVGGTVGLMLRLARGHSTAALLRVPAIAWLLGVGAFFGYHALYFTALQTLPPVEALLIINLWPLLIVLFTGLLPASGCCRAISRASPAASPGRRSWCSARPSRSRTCPSPVFSATPPR
ncbi:MAG TPA: EamA family transporter [Geminicoccaceae bacterium]|nr:EamA family transporter [Geminicoccaceae bacterium]